MKSLRLADLLASVSLVADLGFALPPETSIRSAIIATSLARRIGLSEAQVADVYYTALLEHIGCTGFAHEAAAAYGDEMLLNAAISKADPDRPADFLRALVGARGRLEGARLLAYTLLRGGSFGRRYAAAVCEVGRDAAALALVSGMLALRVPETGELLAADEPTPLIHRAAVGPGLALFAGVAAMSGFFLLGGPHADALGLDAWSLAFLVFGGVVVVCRVLLARIPDRLSPMRLGGAALALAAVGLGVVAASGDIVALLAGTAVMAAGVALMTPALFAATFARVSPAERGSASGTATLFIDLGFGGGPFVAGFVAAGFGIPAGLGAAAAMALAGAVGTLVVPALRSAGPVRAASSAEAAARR